MKPGYFWGICIFSKDRTSGKVAAVKKLVCYMLIVWLALMAGGANAHTHSADMHSHDVIHAHDHDKSVLANIGESTSLEDASTLDADYSEKLNKVHSCHSHTHHHAAGLPSCHDMLAVADLPSLTPVFSQRFACIALANDVERPKWPFTTPAVVSLLS